MEEQENQRRLMSPKEPLNLSPQRGIRSGTLAHRILNGLSFYLLWFMIVYSPLYGLEWISPLIIFLYLCLHDRLIQERANERLLILLVTLIGTSIETLYIQSGLLRYYPTPYWPTSLPPPWVISIYPLFASTLRHSLAYLRTRLPLAALFSSIGAITSYRFASTIGVVELLQGPFSLLYIGAIWGTFTPLCCLLSSSLSWRRSR